MHALKGDQRVMSLPDSALGKRVRMRVEEIRSAALNLASMVEHHLPPLAVTLQGSTTSLDSSEYIGIERRKPVSHDDGTVIWTPVVLHRGVLAWRSGPQAIVGPR